METTRITVLLLLSLVSSASQGTQAGPDALLSAVTSEVVAGLKQDKELADDPSRLEDFMETKVAPVFDFTLMTQLAVGRDWRQTSPEQQNRLTAEFKTMLVRTYSGKLALYRDPTITYKAIRFLPGDTNATVRSEVKQQGSKPLRVDYEMTKMPGEWKVYDVKLNGASIVTAHRGRFTAKIRDVGVDGLIRSLAEKNREGVFSTRGATSMAGG